MSIQIRYETDDDTKEILRAVAKVKNFTAIIEARHKDSDEPPDHIKVRGNPTTKYEEVDDRDGHKRKVKVKYRNPTILHFTLNNYNDVEPFIPSSTPPESAEHLAERAQTILKVHRADILAIRDHIVQWNSLPPEERGKTKLPSHRELKSAYPPDPVVGAEAERALTGSAVSR